MALPNLSQISEALDKIMPELTPVPVGTVAYAHEVPTGWLQCNGAEVSRTTYARLFRKIGTKYGAGNGSTTFNLPDLQHRVLEGTNTTSEVAQKVEAGLPDITGNLTDVAGGATMSFNGRALTGDVTDNPAVFGTSGKGRFASITLQAKRSSDAYGNSATVQPASLRLMPIIKA
jgi:microcystin-dependent protein